MAKVARHGDWFTDGWIASGQIVATATKTFVNGLAVARVGDVMGHWHWWGTWWWVLGVINTGSTSVKAEGQPIARLGDTLSCGCTIVSASPDVDAG